MQILFRAPNWVGDVVMALPALRAIRLGFPKATVSVLCRPWVADLYRLREEVDSVLVEDLRGEHAGKAGQDLLMATLLKGRFDQAIIFPNSFRSAWTLARARIPVRVGYRGELRTPFLTLSVPLRLAVGEHQVFQHLRLALAAGGRAPLAPDTSWSVDQKERDAGKKLLKKAGWKGGATFAVHLASFAHAAKRWELERFANVIDLLDMELGLETVLLGSASERGMNQAAVSLVRRAHVTDISGMSTLPEVLGLLAEATLFVGNDSGISHLAAAVGTPSAVIFGPTDPAATRPWNGPRGDGQPVRIALVRRAPLCAPCRFRICPIDHACMTAIHAEEVVAAARSLLQPVQPVSEPAKTR